MARLNREELLEDSKRYKKVSHDILSSEDLKRKPYFNELNIDQIRDRFRLQSQMYGEFKGSFPSYYRNRGISLKCDMCKYILESNTTLDITCEENMETQRHYLEFCPRVKDIKSQYDTNTDIGLISFFTAVLERRSEEIDS